MPSVGYRYYVEAFGPPRGRTIRRDARIMSAFVDGWHAASLSPEDGSLRESPYRKRRFRRAWLEGFDARRADDAEAAKMSSGFFAR